jgi:hypothetical protein
MDELTDEELQSCVADMAMVDVETDLSESHPEVAAYIDSNFHRRTLQFWHYCWENAPDRMRALQGFYAEKYDEAMRLLK